jgi:hypothetical protein
LSRKLLITGNVYHLMIQLPKSGYQSMIQGLHPLHNSIIHGSATNEQPT